VTAYFTRRSKEQSKKTERERSVKRRLFIPIKINVYNTKYRYLVRDKKSIRTKEKVKLINK